MSRKRRVMSQLTKQLEHHVIPQCQRHQISQN